MDHSYEYVKAPRWAEKDKRRIDCVVKFVALANETPFTADPNDPEAHGREIFERCRAGEFGPVAEFERIAQIDRGQKVSEKELRRFEAEFWPELTDFINELNLAVAKKAHGSAVILSTAMLDQRMGQLLEEQLKEGRVTKDLIWGNSNAPLGTLSARSKLLNAMGIITLEQLAKCDRIRKVRNVFAHEWKVGPSHKEFRKRAIPQLRQLHQSGSGADFYWNADDFDFLIIHVFLDACISLTWQLGEAVMSQRAAKVSRAREG